MIKKTFFTILLLSACDTRSAAISLEKTENSTVKYEVLFNRNGCEIGRFLDGNYVYITLCLGGKSASQSSHTQTCGKNCIRTVNDIQVQDSIIKDEEKEKLKIEIDALKKQLSELEEKIK